ncbi:MAG TPA: major capsid protein, partial [Flavobacteriales bacterium]|nr:major capsid protein [Flavobacteriales bacterium]
FREYFDVTQLQLYDRLYGATQIDDAVFAAYINDVADKAMELQNKIERAYELQCAQVLENGIVQVKVGKNIDYTRKADSLKDLGGGNYWASGSVDPATSIEEGCNFLRKVGKAEGGVFNMLLGSTALRDLLANAKVQDRGKIYNYSLDQIAPPQRNSVGATFHGEISAGSYRVRLWAYPQFYDNAQGVSTPYLNAKKAIIIPETPRFKLAFAAVPQLLSPNTPPKVGAFIMNEYEDKRAKSRIMDIESAGIAVPVAVDTIYTMQVVA